MILLRPRVLRLVVEVVGRKIRGRHLRRDHREAQGHDEEHANAPRAYRESLQL